MTGVALRRYTNLAGTIHVLRHQVITLLSPASWDDRNDAYFLSQYKKRKNVQSVLALCFALAPETYHHWRVFSHGCDGVCIEFDKEALLGALQGIEGLRSRKVIYKEIRRARVKRPKVDELPFLKRFPYKPENEFRLIYVGPDEVTDFKEFDIPLHCIMKITLSPWMPKALVQAVGETLQDIDGCQGLAIRRSTLIENEKWKQLARGEEPD
jgi:hypothetical protein